MRTGDDGRCSESAMPAFAGRGGALLDGRLDGRAEVVRAKVQQDQAGIELRELEQVLGQPVEAFDLLAARLDELGACVRIGVGALAQELVEGAKRRKRGPQLVRDVGKEVAAPVAIASDDLDAFLEPIGHGVELDRELGKLGRPGPDLARWDAAAQVALGEAARCLRQPAQRGREPAGHGRRHDDAQTEGKQGDRGEQPGDVGKGGRAEGVRVRERDLDRVWLEQPARGIGMADPHGPFLGLAGSRLGGQGHEQRLVERRDERDPFAGRHEPPEPDPDIRLAEAIRDHPLLLLVERLEDSRIDPLVQADDDPVIGGRASPALDVDADGFRALLEVGRLLAGEVVVQAVDHEDRDEHQRQRDDADERERQPALEGAREPATHDARGPDASPEAPQAMTATGAWISARRRRSRHPGPSGRTLGRPDRPRSCREGG